MILGKLLKCSIFLDLTEYPMAFFVWVIIKSSSDSSTQGDSTTLQWSNVEHLCPWFSQSLFFCLVILFLVMVLLLPRIYAKDKSK